LLCITSVSLGKIPESLNLPAMLIFPFRAILLVESALATLTEIPSACIIPSREYAHTHSIDFELFASLMEHSSFDDFLSRLRDYVALDQVSEAIEYFWLFGQSDIRMSHCDNELSLRDYGTGDDLPVLREASEDFMDRRFKRELLSLVSGGNIRFSEDSLERNYRSVGLLASSHILRSIDLSGTSVVDLTPLAPLSNLYELNLEYTRVEDISPLSTLVNLQVLNLSYTDVSSVTALSHLTHLHRLDLSGTPASDLIPLSELTDTRSPNERLLQSEILE